MNPYFRQLTLLLRSLETQSLHLPQPEEVPELLTNTESITEELQPHTSRFSNDSIATHDFAINPNRFSAESLSSVLSATPFDFDTKTLSTPSYRQAFGERVRNIVSQPLDSPGGAALLRAAETLEDEERYYEQSIELEWDSSISRSTIRFDDTGSSRSILRTLYSQVFCTGGLRTRRQRIGHPVNPVHVS